MSELQMQEKIAELLRKLGYEVYLEVPFLSRSIDIVTKKDGEICAYELKLHDWRKAVSQSSDFMHGADKSFVCMPMRSKVNEELVESLQSRGLGLVFFDKENNRIEEIVPAQESDLVWEPARKWLTESLSFRKELTWS